MIEKNMRENCSLEMRKQETERKEAEKEVEEEKIWTRPYKLSVHFIRYT